MHRQQTWQKNFKFIPSQILIKMHSLVSIVIVSLDDMLKSFHEYISCQILLMSSYEAFVSKFVMIFSLSSFSSDNYFDKHLLNYYKLLPLWV